MNIHIAISILNLYIKWEKYEKCLETYMEFQKLNIKQNQYIYAILINLYSKLKQPFNGESIIQEMKLQKI